MHSPGSGKGTVMQSPPSGQKLVRLENIGFVRAGAWTLADGMIAVECAQHSTARNVLYAIVVDAEVVYVGKTVQELCKRMQQYRTPGETQPTNRRNRSAIIRELEARREVLLYVLPDNGLMHYGDFHINLAAGLEDSIIHELNPIWNGGRKEAV
jgi:hypothetical protein